MSKHPLIRFESRGTMIIGTINSPSVLDEGDISRMGHEMMDCVESHPGVNLLLNFKHVRYVSSTVVNELLRVRDAIDALHGTLQLCDLNRNVLALFKITGLNSTVKIVRSM